MKLNETVTYNGRTHTLITLPIPGKKRGPHYATIRDPTTGRARQVNTDDLTINEETGTEAPASIT